MSLTPNGLLCPACGYDLRSLTSDRCPECGLIIDRKRSGIIPWERRKSHGYVRSFLQTWFIATHSPMRLARATGSPVEVRSARLFRWIIRALFALPCMIAFCVTMAVTGGLDHAFVVESPEDPGFPPMPLWQLRFLWCRGACHWIVLPVGFLLAVILATGISQWFYFSRGELTQRNRAMAYSFYLPAPLGWFFLCILLGVAGFWIDRLHERDLSQTWNTIQACLGIAVFLVFALIAIAMVNSLRAISIATGYGWVGTVMIGLGIVVQAALATVIGVGLFPAIVGFFVVMIQSLSG